MVSSQNVGFSHRPWYWQYIIRAPIIVSLVCSHCKLCNVKLRIFLLICIKLIVLSFLYEYGIFLCLAQLLWTLLRWLDRREISVNMFCLFVIMLCWKYWNTDSWILTIWHATENHDSIEIQGYKYISGQLEKHICQTRLALYLVIDA